VDARSEKIIRRIVEPEGVPAAERPEAAAEEPMSLAQIVYPRSPEARGYAGPERRAQGYLIAEVVAEPDASEASRPSDFPA
jgi:hypothetical protein